MEAQYTEQDVEALAAAPAEEFPDPVDVFEDQLAHDLGLRRHPSMSLEEWRRVRVRFIDQWDVRASRSPGSDFKESSLKESEEECQRNAS